MKCCWGDGDQIRNKKERSMCVPLPAFQSPFSICLLADPKREPAVIEEMCFADFNPSVTEQSKETGLEAERRLNQHSFKASSSVIQKDHVL